MPDSQVAYVSSNSRKYTCGNAFYRWHINSFMDRVHDLVASTEPRSVLDAGCGEGYVLNHLGTRNPSWQLCGIDLSDEAVAFANANFGHLARFRKGSVYKLPFSDKSFDTVICSEVLEHLDQPEIAIAELKRVARKNVLITVPLEPWFKLLNDTAQRLGISPDPGHVNFWTRSTFPAFISQHFPVASCETKHIYNLALCQVS